MIAIELFVAASDTTAPGRSALDALLEWFDLGDPGRKWLVVFGLVGQATFFFRWIIQWITSERRGESHMPELFWWFSLAGAIMLFTYFVIDHDPVGIVGQGVGWVVYGRNLYLIRFKHRRPAGEPGPEGSKERKKQSAGR